MTSHYAGLHDSTVREHWERARKVNVYGQTVTLDPDGPLAEAAWAKQRVGGPPRLSPTDTAAYRSCKPAHTPTRV
jgi:hypothetical protein